MYEYKFYMIEYKIVKEERVSIKPNLSKLQVLWLRRRYLEGRNVAVAVGTTKGVLIYQHLAWESSQETSKAISKIAFTKWIIDQCSQSTTSPP